MIFGDNEAGKSTILEAINLALTGIISGKSIWNEISQYIFYKEAVDEYIVSLGTASIALPYITIEIFLTGMKIR
ncbi:AAA family ATPase [Anaerovibrio sp.]|uniref:AAA family ATPase n=1 Tax=Anaerovibrio sp. TaxID=1872532 RepID=UPI003F181680